MTIAKFFMNIVTFIFPVFCLDFVSSSKKVSLTIYVFKAVPTPHHIIISMTIVKFFMNMVKFFIQTVKFFMNMVKFFMNIVKFFIKRVKFFMNMATALTMLRLSVSMGKGKTIVELCSVEIALSVCKQ